jgi:hypothetical protein
MRACLSLDLICFARFVVPVRPWFEKMSGLENTNQDPDAQYLGGG